MTLYQKIQAKTGVSQGCLLSPFLFPLVIYSIVKTSTEPRRNGVERHCGKSWMTKTLLDLYKDLSVLSHNNRQIQDETMMLADAAKVGLTFHKGKTTVMKINALSIDPVTQNIMSKKKRTGSRAWEAPSTIKAAR